VPLEGAYGGAARQIPQIDSDVVLAGPNRDEVAALIIPDVEACRKLAPGLAPDAPPAAVLADPRLRETFARFLAAQSDPARGTSARVARAILLAEPPSLDVGEVTDKGSINQRAVLAHRAALVEELYADPPSPNVYPFTSLPGQRGKARAGLTTPAN
jgi:feruloyl-CoA synthase